MKFFENKKKNGGGGESGRVGVRLRGGQGRCKRRSGFVKIKKKIWRGGGVRVDMKN